MASDQVSIIFHPEVAFDRRHHQTAGEPKSAIVSEIAAAAGRLKGVSHHSAVPMAVALNVPRRNLPTSYLG